MTPADQKPLASLPERLRKLASKVPREAIYGGTFSDERREIDSKEAILIREAADALDKAEAEVGRLRSVLHRIGLPDYVLKEDVIWAYRVLDERMRWAREALKPP